MSDLVGNPEDRFSRVAAQIVGVSVNYRQCCKDGCNSPGLTNIRMI